MQTASKKVINGWAMYDWANSVYNLVITTTFFPVYYTEMTRGEPFNESVRFLGRSYVNTALYNYALAFTYILVALTLPILSSIADYKGSKKKFMQVFCFVGALGCSSLYFFDEKHFDTGIFSMMIAAYGFYASLVFYNSYLPEIAAPKDRDRISARGFSFGYIGSVIMQIIGFLLVVFWDKIPFLQNEAHAVRFTFLLVGIWWFGFAQIPFARLPHGTASANGNMKNVFTSGFLELKKVFNEFKKIPVMKRFLLAFFFYNMGVQTIMLVASNFGSKVLHLPKDKLIITVVLIQLVAIAGAWGMSRLSMKFGNFPVLIGVVSFWMLLCFFGYLMQTENQFYALAMAVGLVMGGIQSLSRSTYAKLMPVTRDTASYFSFYDVTEKIAIALGLLSFAYIEEKTVGAGGMRNSVLALVVFFAIGLLFLFYAKAAPNKPAEIN
ncbi:MAG: MFS transporter permease [Niastella sp. SCN 39-18]|nr:MFS transporter [Sphingobacteriales bacterium]ODT54018.1 MAG: MFS transporter permease [Niastella sp. SCN 39-18]OJW09825.1 MAG: MFS transporter [Sphingobacteriales bacterium 39-19]